MNVIDSEFQIFLVSITIVLLGLHKMVSPAVLDAIVTPIEMLGSATPPVSMFVLAAMLVMQAASAPATGLMMQVKHYGGDVKKNKFHCPAVLSGVYSGDVLLAGTVEHFIRLVIANLEPVDCICQINRDQN